MKIEEAIEWMEEAVQETTECFEQCSPSLQKELVMQKEAFELAITALRSMPTLTPPNEPEHAGLYGKYTVYKNKDGSLVTDCFILRPAKDPAAVAALRAYAAATDNAELAADIINWVGAKPNEALTLEQLCEMDGKPVWVEDKCDPELSAWGNVCGDACVVSHKQKYYGTYYIEDYEGRWLAYSYPPARIDRSKWISVKERLPERFEPVLVCREKNGSPYVEQGHKDVGEWWKVYGTRTKQVTHWMPLPEPPEEG